MTNEQFAIELVSDFIHQAKRIVVFTGAGVSTESGIPDFRSPGGLWEKYDPSEFTYDKFLTSKRAREIYWKLEKQRWSTIAQARPNFAHYAVTQLEQMGKLDYLITQNVDGLHQIAGTSKHKIIEIHGSVRTVFCLTCGKRYKREAIQTKLEKGV